MISKSKTKYLFYESWPSPGIEGLNNWLEVLEDFIGIALNVHRIPVIPDFYIINNNNKPQNRSNFRCEDYLDLTHTEIYRFETDGVIKKQPGPLEWISEKNICSKLPARLSAIKHVDIDQLYTSERKKYRFLSLTHIKKDYAHPQPYHYVKTVYSEQVNKLTDTVLSCFNTTRQSLLDTQSLLYKNHRTGYIHRRVNIIPYICLNLYNVQFSKYANKHSETLSVINHIITYATRLNRLNRGLTNVYLILRDRELRFVKTHKCQGYNLRLYTYHDFAELKLISENEYLLYSTEKNIFNYAVVKIYPPGANRAFYSGVSRLSRYSKLSRTM